MSILLKSTKNLLPGILFLSQCLFSQVWKSDLGNGNYRNPVLYADYSDPDVIRVGDDFYMVASSFNCVPGIPILHSRDLVNWEIAGYALERLHPSEVYDLPQHGNGVWAPSIRYHLGEFYIYYPDPDFGIFMVKSKNLSGPWDKPVLVKEAKGWIDPCPLWDDNGDAYLVHAYAGSRAGIKSIIVVNRMNPEGTMVIDDDVLVFDGHSSHPTIEGPKFYRRNGYYYIFAPAGGVPTGWQTILRSKNIYGPYEEKIVLHQGNTTVNGPHQGAWVELETGESWFIHFQDKGAYGRIVHLQPVLWKDDWPLIGKDINNDGIGEPVMTYRKPSTKINSTELSIPASDEFNDTSPGLQWQWQANPGSGWMFMARYGGFLRLNCILPPEGYQNLWTVPNLFLQKIPAPAFTATVKLNFMSRLDGDRAGLVIMGTDYSYISAAREGGKLYVTQTLCTGADQKGKEVNGEKSPLPQSSFYLRVSVKEGCICSFSYSTDGKTFIPSGDNFTAKPGKWIGAKIGLFALSGGRTNDSGYADIDWFRIE